MSSDKPSDPQSMFAPSDPQAIRALAHPVRIKLLSLLAHAGTLTATEASTALGESPANCAFHLRTLAKYGFIEEAGGGRGRERPWRRAYTSLFINALGDPEYAEAAAAFTELALTDLLSEAAKAMRTKAGWPPEWQRLPAREATTYLTPAEAAELSADLNELLSRYEYRLRHPERRPADSVPIEFLLLAWPELDKVNLSRAQRQHGADATDGDAARDPIPRRTDD